MFFFPSKKGSINLVLSTCFYRFRHRQALVIPENLSAFRLDPRENSKLNSEVCDFCFFELLFIYDFFFFFTPVRSKKLSY